MYHGNVANMIHIFYRARRMRTLYRNWKEASSAASGKQMSAKAARVDTGLDVCTIRYKTLKETFLLDPDMYHGNVA